MRQTITIFCAHLEDIDADSVEIPGHPWLALYIHPEGEIFSLSEGASGTRFCSCLSKEDGVKKVLEIIDKYGVSGVKEKINRACEARRFFKL